MSEHTLVAEFSNAASATRMGKEVAAFLTKAAKEFDKAAVAAGEWPDEPTPAAVAFGRKHGVKWDEPLTWGNDRLAGSEPEVGLLHRALVIFHNDIAGGFGADLPKVLVKAGGTVRMTPRPPIVYGEIPIRPATRALVEKLATWFQQRLGGKELQQWAPPPWSRRAPSFGRAADVQFVVDAAGCAFTLPVQPSELTSLSRFLDKAKARVTLEVATRADEQALAKRELAAAGALPASKAVKAGAGGKIPTKIPSVKRVDGPETSGLYSTGAALYALVDDGMGVARGDQALKRLPGMTLAKQATSLFVDGEELWVAGAGLWHSRDGGKSLKKLTMPAEVDPEFWGKEFHGVAKDSSGVVWVGGTWVVTVRGTKVVHEKTTFGNDARVKAVVATPLGTLLLTFTGTAFMARDGQAKRLAVRGKGHLSAACVTPRGTLILVGSGATWSAEIYRSEDQGVTFKPVKLAKLAPLQSVAALPDGRLVAGGNNLLLASTDDGKTWKPVKAPKDAAFDIMCRHGDAVIVGGDRLEIT